MRTFRLADADFAALAAGRPPRHVLAELRRAEISRHLLLQTQLPSGYAVPRTHPGRADPMSALHTAATLAALRAGAAPPPGSVPSRKTLHAEHDGLAIAARLEDRDPLRARLGLTPTAELSPAELARWQALFEQAWHLLVARHRPMAETLAEVLSVIIPVEPDPGAGGISATSAQAYGAVAMSAPADATAFAVGLLHETQHSVLNAVMVLFDLVTPTRERGYSPWRDDPRPPTGVLHGAYAYQAVTRFWRTEAQHAMTDATGGGGALAAFEFVRWRDAVVAAADGLLAGEHLTPAGRRFAGALRAEVAAWRDQPGGERIARLAREASADHRIRWRLRNLEVSAATVALLVDAWRRGADAPAVPEATVRTGRGRVLAGSDRLRLVHALLRGQSPDDDAKAVAGHGTPSGAAGRDDEFWAAVALAAPGGPMARPELARALWQAAPTGDIDALVRWTAQVRPAAADGRRGGEA